MTVLSDVILMLEDWAPKATQQSYDNVGLQVGDASAGLTRAIIALDLTPEVVEEAIMQKAELIITHHPLIFRPLKSVTSSDWHGSLILKLASAGIALYCIHTNLDAAKDGVSFALAKQIGLHENQFLKPLNDTLVKNVHPYKEVAYDVYPLQQADTQVGMGIIGELQRAEALEVFLERVASSLSTNGLRFVGNKAKTIKRVAVCGGSGSDLIVDAMRAGADAYLTADITYHRFFDVLDTSGTPQMALIDAMHYETEACTEDLLKEWLTERFSDIKWIKTKTRTSPIEMYVRS